MTQSMDATSGLHRRQSEPRTRERGTWVEILPHLDPKFGGMSVAVPQLASRLIASQAYAVQFAAFCPQDEAKGVRSRDGMYTSHWPRSRAAWLRDTALRRRFAAMLREADGVHIHGLWEAGTDVAARMARVAGRPYVISAHGMLDPWALASKGWKKKVYSVLRERANVEGAACLHALTRAEADDYRRFGSRRPIALIPNGVDVPRAASADLLLDAFPALRGKRIVLYLGRIHPKKGLDLLANAWSALHLRFPDAALVIAGPDEQGTQATLAFILRELGTDSSVVFTGMLQADMKWSAFAAAHCFVLPSYSEGLSVAVLESLGMGVPVIVTRQCHMPEVGAWGAGMIIEAETGALYRALEIMLTQQPSTHAEMKRCGRQLARERFGWDAVARQMAELYAWVQGGPRPQTVELLEVAA